MEKWWRKCIKLENQSCHLKAALLEYVLVELVLVRDCMYWSVYQQFFHSYVNNIMHIVCNFGFWGLVISYVQAVPVFQCTLQFSSSGWMYGGRME
jgi:hypothetical protein